MRQHLPFLASVVAFVFLSTINSYAVEESLDLDAVTEPTPTQAEQKSTTHNSLGIMGRVDLTFDKTVEDNSELKNQHFLLFLKARPSSKVSFMGEFVQQTFYYLDYTQSARTTLSFGKILIPFGDNRYFHRFYGGVQGYGATGVMFPNIWAEPGVNANIKIGNGSLDFYWVNAFTAANVNSDVNFQTSTDERQALGTRYQFQVLENVQFIASAYGAEYWPGRPVYMGGLDFYTSYGALGLKRLRFSAGLANAWIEGSPTGRNFQKRGDYFQIATNVCSMAEWRLRYGTYEHDDRNDTADDSQSLNIGATIPIDVMKLLVEYQLNFEAKDEVDNDLARAMLSVDF